MSISLKGIYKDYYLGGQTLSVLKDLNLTIEKEDHIAITGPSGSGKSTLMNILGCLDTPTRGDYILNNREVSRLSDEELSKVRNLEIGFVYQTFNLLMKKNVVENVGLPLAYSREKPDWKGVHELIERVGLGDRKKHLPNELSGGQRQRVAIARALVNSPSLLLADEPTGNLDSKTTEEIMNLFEAIYKQGTAIVIVTHEPDIARRCRAVIELTDGLITRFEKRRRPASGTKRKMR